VRSRLTDERMDVLALVVFVAAIVALGVVTGIRFAQP